ncbi:MAG: helix-turn-helix transcriptional regulator, partial [Propionibacteriales bacterium]|nr:helix-turn-helix transcriptional regulator [Propionibacteriales bacterium]
AACWATAGVSRVPVAELARAAHVSAGHLHRTFRQAFGCGPARALELVRLARAATALQRSNTTISDVAAAHGFANPYHFSRRFAHTYGSPPHAFRTREPLTDPMWPLRETQLLAVAAPLLSQVNDLPHPM